MLPAAAVVIVGELRSKIQGARGVSPADGRSSTITSRPTGQVSSAASSKAFARWSFLGSGWRQRRPEPVIPGDGSLQLGKGLGTCL
jgi:hypothetical protein